MAETRPDSNQILHEGSSVKEFLDSQGYNTFDPVHGIKQKVMNGEDCLEEFQRLLDKAGTTATRSRPMFVDVYPAVYLFSDTLYIPVYVYVRGMGAPVQSPLSGGVTFKALPNFGGWTSGTPTKDIVNFKSVVDNAALFWSGGFSGVTGQGATDGSCRMFVNTINNNGDNLELSDLHDIGPLCCRFMNGAGFRFYAGVPNQLHKLRPICCNGPGIVLDQPNFGDHTISVINMPSADQCHGGAIRLKGLNASQMVVITGLKSERKQCTASEEFDGGAYRTLLRDWRTNGHDGQANAITFESCTDGNVTVVGCHHISAYEMIGEFVATSGSDLFTANTAHNMETGGTTTLTTSGTLPTGLSISTTYWVKSESATTYKLATSESNLNNNIFITVSSSGTGVHRFNGGIKTAGDMFKLVSGSWPVVTFSSAAIRYRVTEKGTKPNMASSVGPLLVNYPIEIGNGTILSTRPYVYGSSYRTKLLIGNAEYKGTASLNEDSVVQVIGNLPGFSLHEMDADANKKTWLITASNGNMNVRAVKDDGSQSVILNFTTDSSGNPSSISAFASLTMDDGKNINVGTTTGTRIGSVNTQKLSFWGVTPIVQPSGIPSEATDDTSALALLNYIRNLVINTGLART